MTLMPTRTDAVPLSENPLFENADSVAPSSITAPHVSFPINAEPDTDTSAPLRTHRPAQLPPPAFCTTTFDSSFCRSDSISMVSQCPGASDSP